MGAGASNMGVSAPSRRPEADPRHRRRSSIRRSISSFIVCGASSSYSHAEEDFPPELLAISAKIGDGLRLNDKRAASIDITSIQVSSTGTLVNGYEIPELQRLLCNVGPGDEGRCLSEKIIPICNDTANASCMVEQSIDSVSANEMANFDVVEDFSEIKEAPSNSNHLPSHGYGESSLDESEAIDSDSEDGLSVFSDSPIAFHLMQRVMPSAAEFIESEREQNMQKGILVQGDLMGVHSNIPWSNYVEIDVHDKRNYRRSFSPSRNSISSTDESDYSGSPDSCHHAFSGDFLTNSIQGSLEPGGSETRVNNELGWNSRSEFMGRLHGNLDSTNNPTDLSPRRIHADSSSTEETGSHALPRITLLAQTLFEVLDQIHQQPMSLSLSTTSLPAPQSVVDSLPVKIHRKGKITGCTEDVPQCHICLAAYEEGDKIRVLPCLHEFHMSCVNKWLNEIRGVCPLCRGDVCIIDPP